ncbi:MAG TPA: PaaI family thioesterase [Tepidisphaeraceae bacterium]|jgi:acyl-coenzyme A thioesterase PaaI-like protein
MPLELPHTPGCLVCGPVNSRGLHLSLFVDPATGIVETRYVPAIEHIGFEGIVHGGAIATVLDEVMVWAASWHGKRFCVCGEMNVRFRQSGKIGSPLMCRAKIESSRARLITTTAEALDESGQIIASATGKYVPLPPDQNRAFVQTFIKKPATEAAAKLMHAAV